jgi:nucleotide-binding universal stress UspA family protein
MIHRLLIGTDESTQAESAATWASGLARTTGAAVTVAEAFRSPQAERSPDIATEIREEMRDRVEAWVDRVWAAGVEPPFVGAFEGEPQPVLTEAARQFDADLVIIGSKEFEGVTALGLGSLAHSLAHHLDCPLIVVPSSAKPLVDGWIVVGTDGSDRDDVTLEWSDMLARAVGAHLCAVHSGDDEAVSHADRHIAAVHERPERPVGDDTADLLRGVATDRDAGLIVVAASDRHILGGHLLGAVPDHLLHHPTHPVAVLPHAFRGQAATRH